MKALRRVVGTAALAAAGAYFLDPENGARRRALAKDRIAATFRGAARDAKSTASATTMQAADRARGAAHEAKRKVEPDRAPANDADLAQRVESEAFRASGVAKDSVNVNAEMGIVYLRGEIAGSDQRQALVAAATAVDGVRGVEDLLHLPGEPAEAKHETEEETRLRVEKNPMRSANGEA